MKVRRAVSEEQQQIVWVERYRGNRYKRPDPAVQEIADIVRSGGTAIVKGEESDKTTLYDFQNRLRLDLNKMGIDPQTVTVNLETGDLAIRAYRLRTTSSGDTAPIKIQNGCWPSWLPKIL